MPEKNYILPPESTVNIAFQYNKINYNLHINTLSGIIKLSEHANTKAEPELTYLINNKPCNNP